MTTLPLNDHYLRMAKGSAIDPTTFDVDPSIFRLRPEDQGTGLSGNWLEFFKGATRDDAIKSIWEAHKVKGRNFTGTYRLAELNVGSTTAHVSAQAGKDLTFRHHREDNDPSHSGIHGYSPEDDIVAMLISQTVKQLHAPPPKPK